MCHTEDNDRKLPNCHEQSWIIMPNLSQAYHLVGLQQENSEGLYSGLIDVALKNLL